MGLKKLLDAFRVRHEEVYSKGVKLQVVENGRLTMLKLDSATQSKIDRRSVYMGGFWDYFIPLAYAYDKPRILMIGLGLGTIPYQLHSLLGNMVRLDIVEYDSNVVALAKKYAPARFRDRLFVEEGCGYVVRTSARYDVIILDAFSKGARIPKQFYEETFVRNASRILKADGVLAINYPMHPYGIVKLGGYKRLLKRFFTLYSIGTNSTGDMQMIVCSKKLDKAAMLKRIRKKMKPNRENRSVVNSYRDMREV